MKKNNYKNLYILAACIFAVPFSASAEEATSTLSLSPSLAVKSCQVKYQAEVAAVFKLVDKTKAQKKVAEIKTLRKEQDQNIKTIFEKIENKVEDADKKDIVAEHKDDVLKTIDDRRTKIDDLQETIQISKTDVERIVKNTLLTFVDADNQKTCPMTTVNAKEIRKVNTVELKKLAEEKSALYQKQTKEIQQTFLQEVKNTLNDLTEDLKK